MILAGVVLSVLQVRLAYTNVESHHYLPDIEDGRRRGNLTSLDFSNDQDNPRVLPHDGLIYGILALEPGY